MPLNNLIKPCTLLVQGILKLFWESYEKNKTSENHKLLIY